MKYLPVILDAFKKLGFSPRPGQMEAVNDILIAFIDNSMQNYILSAPTGTGKSLIGAVASEALTLQRDRGARCSSIMLCSTNVLSTQYYATFSELQKLGDYLMIKGANNYDCTVLSTPEEPTSAESCAYFTMLNSGPAFAQIMDTDCKQCEYRNIAKKKNTTRHVTTNYSYYFVDRMYTGKFENRDLVVWDESHLVNDLFSEHNAIYFSQKRIQAFSKELHESLTITDVEISKTLSSIAADCARKNKINDDNYQVYLKALHKVYTYAKDRASELADKALRSNNMKAYTRLSKLSKKYEGLGCKIDDFFIYNYDHVFENKEEEAAISVKPVFVGNMFKALQCSDHNLFMSATISKEMMVTTLNLDPDKTAFSKLPSTFPKENKQVIFFDPISLSYTSLQNPDTVKTLRKNTRQIVKHHIEEGDRGIILTPSFKLQTEIVAELMPLASQGKFRMFEHKQGEKLQVVLDEFKKYKNGPAVLISPSAFEGIDLSDDLSRFQIIVKAPFPSLGDKRMKFILDKYPEIYEIITIQKLVQGAGRSVRSPEDYAKTYMLDQNAQRLFTSAKNIWKDEFELRFTKFL